MPLVAYYAVIVVGIRNF